MTDDIVTRLRDEYASCECSGINRDCDRCETEQDAAGEIEELRQKEFMWKMSCVRIATKFMPLSLLLSKEEKEELQIIIMEAVNG